MLHNDKQFSIEETVNKNIEKHQFPNYKNHKSLIGWCTMNYPKVLQNPKYMPRPQPRDEDYYDRKADELKYMYQIRPKEMRDGIKFDYKKPFENFKKFSRPTRDERLGMPPEGFKQSGMCLTTVPKDTRKKIIEEENVDQRFSSIQPKSSEVGKNHFGDDYSRRIRQIGEISYQPSYQNEDYRHLKKLPNTVLTEQNMLEIMNSELKYMNLHNHTWIPNELISKIGYFANNIEELDLSETLITDDILRELSISCEQLHSINVSNCKHLTSEGIKIFLQNKRDSLVKFASAYMDQQIDDDIIDILNSSSKLNYIDLSYCTKITDKALENFVMSSAIFKQIRLAGCENIKDGNLVKMIENSKSSLTHVDLSFNPQKEIGRNVCKALSNCGKLQEIVFTGSVSIGDDGLSALTSSTDATIKTLGYQELSIIKLGGCEQISDSSLGKLLQSCPALTYIELNHLEKLSEYTLNKLVDSNKLPLLKRVTLNFTPNIEDEVLAKFSEENPRINFIRTTVKHTDIKDDQLRMPYPLESKIKVKPKKKKKK